MPAELRRRAILLARLSDNREDLDLTDEGIPRSLDDQIARMREKASQLGWEVWKVIKNPRLSAYKKRKLTLPGGAVDWRVYRPDLREALDDLYRGRANALLTLDLDRAFRDPRDLQDLINVVENSDSNILVESVYGSLRMWKGGDNFDAEIRVLVANKASRDTARRVAASRERRAKEGKFGGGKRPFGFQGDGITVDLAEAKVIKDATRAVLAGSSLRAVTQDLRDRGVPSAKGGPWSPSALKDILMRPRNAGILVYKGEELKQKAPWEPIVPEDEFRAICSKLHVRKAPPGRAPRYLGSGIYYCCCGGKVQAHNQPSRSSRYRCKDTGLMAGNHTSRDIDLLDGFISDLIIEWCSQPVALRRLAIIDRERVDVDSLRAEALALKERLDQKVRDNFFNKVTDAQLHTFTELTSARLNVIDETLAKALPDSPALHLAEAAGDSDAMAERRTRVRTAWADLSLGTKRLIVRELLIVKLLPARRGRGFDSRSIEVKWNL